MAAEDTAKDSAQIYLISPKVIELASFSQDLAAVLDARPVACFRLALAAEDEDSISRAADLLRETCHARDVAIVIEQHYRLVEPLGLDGCHLPDGPRQLRDVRKALGTDAIVGAHCGASRHNGLSAGEAGADYVCFGPVAGTALGGADIADIALFQWWSEMIEVPVVAEGGLDAAQVENLAGVTDFFGIGREIWAVDNPVAALKDLLAPLD
jgi:thiamine-phosphate pyrophosphorylase